jgi:hypothetical protein
VAISNVLLSGAWKKFTRIGEAIRCKISYSPGRNTGHNAEPRLADATSGRGNQGLEQGSLLRGRIAAVCGVARRFPREPDS